MRRFITFGITIVLAAISATGAQSAEAFEALTPQNLAKFSPRARADIVASLMSNGMMLKAAEINSAARLYHFVAQIATETGGFRRLDEDLNYSAERLVVVFKTRVNAEQAQQLQRRPVAIANHVYGNRLGNRGRQSNDGWNYRGSGFLQLTGRTNFVGRGREVGLDLEADPDLARNPKEGLLAATAYWNARKINQIADTNSIEAVRRAVNGGLVGINEARLWLARAHRAFGPTLQEAGLESADAIATANSDELEAARAILQERGYLDTQGLESGGSAEDFSAAINELQRARNLPEVSVPSAQLESGSDVSLPEDILYELTDPQRAVEAREAAE